MASQPWDRSGAARRALQGIVADQHFGIAALSQPAVMTNLLKDLLPDEPREAGLLVAAAQADLAGALRGYQAQGLDTGTATRLTAGAFVNSTSHTPEACTWVVTELAMALGMDPAGQSGLTATPLMQPTLAQQTQAGPTFTPGQPAWQAGQPPQLAGAAPVQGTPGSQAPPAWQQPAWQPPAWQPPAQPGSANVFIPAAVAGLAGALLLLLGSVLPWVKYVDEPASSLFGGYKGAPASETFWVAIEPGVVLVAVIVVSVMLLARRGKPSTLAGMLLAFGIQTCCLFGGYVFVIYAPSKREPGGVFGLLAGLVLIVAGLICRTVAQRQTAGQLGQPGQAAGPPVSPAPF